MNPGYKKLLFPVILSIAAITLLFLYFKFSHKETQFFSGDQQEQKNQQQEQPQVFEPKSLTWSLATSSAGWEARDSAVSFVFQNKIWTMGGLDGNKYVEKENAVRYWEAPHFNDIWTTENGATWEIAKARAEWPPRRSMSVVYFQDKLWMLGGWSPITGYESDIWQSIDGINWTKVVSNAPWPAREGQTAEVFQNKIWMFGGVDYDKHETKNDVWYSENGMDWQQATTTIPWSSRWDHATAVFKDKIFLAGGMDLKGGVFNDIWVSSDGLNWELVTANAQWATRQGHSLVVFKNKLWLIGRFNDNEGGGVNDVWYSDDGIIWQKTDSDPPWIGREDHSALVFNDRIYVFGGMGSDWKWRNDVWISLDNESSIDLNVFPALRENANGFALSAESFMSVFAASNGGEKILIEKNKNRQLPIASITKLFTALVANERYKPDSVISISENSLETKGPSDVYYIGERFLFTDALQAMLVGSHNEIASVLAEQTSTDEFVDAMNEKTSELGLSDTQFVNPTGLDPPPGSDSINYSSVYDLYKLAKYIQKNQPGILSITAKKEFRLFDAGGNFVTVVSSTDKLLGRENIPYSIIGGKTGETPRAKQNLVLVTESPCGGKLFNIVLGSQDNFGDMEKLLRYVNESYDWSCLPQQAD